MPDSRQPGLAVAMTAHDSGRTIRRAIESVHAIAERIVVVDSGSTDDTIEICRELGAEVIERPWEGHVKQKQFALDQCRECAWTLLLDSDESLEPELAESIARVVREEDSGHAGWSMNRKLWFLGDWLHHTCQPEWRLRLIRSDAGRVAGADPHDRLEVDGSVGRLAGVMRHDSYASMQDLSRRALAYAEVASRQRSGGGTLFHLLVSPSAAFFKQLVLRRSFLDGRRGLLVACMDFNATMLKHAFIAAHRLEEGDA